MPFHTPAFAFLCVVTFALYWRGRERFQHALLLISSFAFYWYAGLVDLIVLLSTVGANFLVSTIVDRNRGQSRGPLAAIITFDLGVLAYWKYRAFGVDLFNQATGARHVVPSIVIPLGISFYIFQMIAYQVDLHRGIVAREKSFLRLLLYILFFPHHQAGPIMRPAAFLPQFYGEKRFDAALAARGGMWILWGLCKKVIADKIAIDVDAGFAGPEAVVGAASAWLLALRYAAQIYGDFSGYSDIAVGLGLLFGYDLDRNFNQPYLSTTPAELWRRWHITLSEWLRDYLYIPLGGNRGGPARTQVNLLLTMILGGLWHGASPMFLLWGLLHGLFLVFQRAVPALFKPRGLGLFLTFAGTVIAWVPFRSPTWPTATRLVGTMFGAHGSSTAREWAKALLFAAIVLGFQWFENAALNGDDRRARARDRWLQVPAPVRGLVLGSAIVGVLVGLADHTSFIYFRF